MANPNLSASIDINASPEQVWSIVSDLSRMPEFSPQASKVFVRGGNPIGLGTKTFNINRRGLLRWPTRSTVVGFEPNQKIAWRVKDNHTVWSYTLEPTATRTGTKLTGSRNIDGPDTTVASRSLIAMFMGGGKNFDAEMESGIATTLAAIKSAAERG